MQRKELQRLIVRFQNKRGSCLWQNWELAEILLNIITLPLLSICTYLLKMAKHR
jgi:hypothetical protein